MAQLWSYAYRKSTDLNFFQFFFTFLKPFDDLQPQLVIPSSPSLDLTKTNGVSLRRSNLPPPPQDRQEETPNTLRHMTMHHWSPIKLTNFDTFLSFFVGREVCYGWPDPQNLSSGCIFPMPGAHDESPGEKVEIFLPKCSPHSRIHLCKEKFFSFYGQLLIRYTCHQFTSPDPYFWWAPTCHMPHPTNFHTQAHQTDVGCMQSILQLGHSVSIMYNMHRWGGGATSCRQVAMHACRCTFPLFDLSPATELLTPPPHLKHD